MSLWKRSPEKYIEKYLHDGTQFITREMAFGKSMAVALEEGKESEIESLNHAMRELPSFEKHEYPVRADMKIDGESLPLLAVLDTAKADLSAFKEYKTGKEPWTQRRVDEDAQISFYVTTIYVLTKKIIRDVELVWVETENDDSPAGIRATGKIAVFQTQRTMGQIINTMAEMRKVWREIGERCEKELI